MTAVPSRPAAPETTPDWVYDEESGALYAPKTPTLRRVFATEVEPEVGRRIASLMNAAPGATAGDGLRDVLAERDLLQRQLVHMTAERDGLTRKLRDVLAAAARDAELRKRVEAALAELDKQAAVHDMHGLVTAHRPIAARLRRALDVP